MLWAAAIVSVLVMQAPPESGFGSSSPDDESNDYTTPLAVLGGESRHLARQGRARRLTPEDIADRAAMLDQAARPYGDTAWWSRAACASAVAYAARDTATGTAALERIRDDAERLFAEGIAPAGSVLAWAESKRGLGESQDVVEWIEDRCGADLLATKSSIGAEWWSLDVVAVDARRYDLLACIIGDPFRSATRAIDRLAADGHRRVENDAEAHARNSHDITRLEHIALLHASLLALGRKEEAAIVLSRALEVRDLPETRVLLMRHAVRVDPAWAVDHDLLDGVAHQVLDQRRSAESSGYTRGRLERIDALEDAPAGLDDEFRSEPPPAPSSTDQDRSEPPY